jgi:hypothetical protein
MSGAYCCSLWFDVRGLLSMDCLCVTSLLLDSLVQEITCCHWQEPLRDHSLVVLSGFCCQWLLVGVLDVSSSYLS